MWQRALSKWMQYRLSEARIERLLRRTMQPLQAPPPVPGKLRVSCVQRELKPAAGLEEYLARLDCFVSQAAAAGSQLVVFPEYNFLDLLGLVPGFGLAERFVSGGSSGAAETGDSSLVLEIFRSMAPAVSAAFYTVGSLLAGNYKLYLYTGSFVTVDESGCVFNTGVLFAPDGTVVGEQRKLHLTPIESAMGMGRGSCLQVYELSIGRIAFPVCMDATYFETFQLAVEQGAQVVIIPIANPEEYSMWRALRGIWGRVQEAYVYGVKASLNGTLVGMRYTGKAGVFAPLELTPQGDGVLALAAHHEGSELVTAELDLAALADARAKAPYWGDRNPSFEQEYVKRYTSRRGERE